MASSSSSSPELSAAAPIVETHPRFSYKDATQEEVLEDLSSRFILNLPDEELTSIERVCFQVEQAHWFYEDFIREENTKLPSMALKKFSEMLFHACPLLQQWSHDHEEAFKNFMQYKTRVPVCGAIMLNDAMDQCVLVKGWKASSNWGFPKGKINETEPPASCAIREVLEETGYNLAGQLDPANVIELSIKEQKISLFIVPGVPEDFNFQTRTRKEISQIAWFKLSDLPTWRRSKTQPPNKKFYLISPFIGPLKNFINERRPRNGRKVGKQKRIQLGQPLPLASNQLSPANGVLESKSQIYHGENDNLRTQITQRGPAIDPPSGNPTVDPTKWSPELMRLFGDMLTQNVEPSSERRVIEEANNVDGDASYNSKTIDAAHHSDASGDSPVAPRVTEQSDWSSTVPPHYAQPSEALASANKATVSFGPKPLPPLRSQSSRPSMNGHGHAPIQPVSRPVNQVPTSPLSPPATSPRRATATADISPYLSRATAATPVSIKTLQHLQLLETVADESARLAPIIAARAAMASRGPIPNGYPLPPSSVPPQMPSPNTRDIGILYSSTNPGYTSSAAGFHPRILAENPALVYSDPFQVRSRTSQAFHRPPMHNPTGSVSMSQNHLLATLNGFRGGPISPSYPINPQFMHQHQPPSQQPPFFNGSSPYPPPGPGPAPYLPLSVMHGYAPMPNPLAPPTAPPLYSTPNPNIPHGMNMAPMPSHNPLLSLLNGRSTQTSAAPAPVHQ